MDYAFISLMLFRYVWHVPLNYRTQGGEYGLVWLNQTTSGESR